MYLLKRCHDEFDIDRAKAIDTIRQVRREEKGSEGVKELKQSRDVYGNRREKIGVDGEDKKSEDR